MNTIFWVLWGYTLVQKKNPTKEKQYQSKSDPIKNVHFTKLTESF